MSTPPRRQTRQPSAGSSHFVLSNSPTNRLLPTTTFSYIASWRGQLLICTVVLALGAVYFIIREPISRWRSRRREVLSRVREEELLSMETDASTAASSGNKVKDDEVEASTSALESAAAKSARERGREKRKEVKKKKGSVFGVKSISSGNDSSVAGMSSIESSPAPMRDSQLGGKSSRSFLSPPSPSVIKGRRHTASGIASSSSNSDLNGTMGGLDEPATGMSTFQLSSPAKSSANPEVSETLCGQDEIEDEETAERPPSNGADNQQGEELPESSYVQENGISAAASSSKKKKKRGKSRGEDTLSVGEMGSRQNGDSETGRDSIAPLDERIPSSVLTRHRRQLSITSPTPVQAQELETLLESHERMIDSLRAEIGQAKAEEGKAKEDAKRSKISEERLRGDLERMRKGLGKAENENRRREGELQSRLSHLASAHSQVVHRLATLETMLRENGQILGPLPSPLPPQFHAQSPLPPSSPFGFSFHSPSVPGPAGPGTPNGVAYHPYPSPGMYPSPMVHHHGHLGQAGASIPPPSPYRRASSASVPTPSGLTVSSANGGEYVLAGPLTPGFVPNQSPRINPVPLHPMGSGVGASPTTLNGNGLGPSSPSSRPNAAELRRLSIESSVLKKKVQKVGGGSESGGSEPLVGLEEQEEGGQGMNDGELNGLGMGTLGDIDVAVQGVEEKDMEKRDEEETPRNDSGHSDLAQAHAESESNNKEDLPSQDTTVASPTRLVFDTNGHSATSSPVSGRPHPSQIMTYPLSQSLTNGFNLIPMNGLRGIRCISDGERGNVYVRDEIWEGYERGGKEMIGSNSASGTNSTSNSNSVNGDGRISPEEIEAEYQDEQEPVSINDGDTSIVDDDRDTGEEEVKYEPLFPSLAHTPAQLEEIRKMREETMKGFKDRGRGRAKSRSSLGGGVVVPLLTPSPSMSPGSKRVILDSPGFDAGKEGVEVV